MKVAQIDIEYVADYLIRIDNKKKQLETYRPLQSAGLLRLREELAIEWTYNSNSIEGNTLTLAETRMVLNDGITVGGKTLREHFEIINHQEAIGVLENYIQPDFKFTERIISDIHFILLKNIMPDFAGRYRNIGVRITGANFTPPNALKVDFLINQLIEKFNNSIGQMHPVIMASLFHHQFVWIHPFTDGNGRTVRLIYNLFLMSLGFPPAIILRADRNKYYTALNHANKGDYKKLFLLMCQAVERSLDIYLSNIENYAEEYQPIKNIVEEPNIPYGQEYVSLLARQGKIDAYKEGKVWFTRVDAVLDYMNNRERVRVFD